MGRSNSYLKHIKDKAAENLRLGHEFLSQNSQRENVISLVSGLQYEIIELGAGPTPKIKDKVLCHYSGTLLNGEIFDSSYKRKKPESFVVKELIKGWQEALLIMPVGSHWKLVVPSNLAYGFDSITETSGGNCTLIFDIKLISIL